MHITQYTDFSIRVLIYLTIHGEKLCTISDIANSYNISKNHLMKIVQQLSQKGYLHSVRGKNGGIRLKESPSNINIGTLIRDMEGETKIVECFGKNNQCVITSDCKMKNIFARAQENFYQTLEEYTLQDLVGPKEHDALKNILFIDTN